MKKLYSLADNKIISILFKVVILGGLAGIILYNVYSYVTSDLSQLDPTEAAGLRGQVYINSFVALLLIIYYFTSGKELKKQSFAVRQKIREDLEGSDNIAKDQELDVIRIKLREFKFMFIFKRIGVALVGIMIFIAIFYTEGIVDLIAKVLTIGYLFYIYKTFNEDPEDLLGSKKYDRQFVDREGGLAVYMEDTR